MMLCKPKLTTNFITMAQNISTIKKSVLKKIAPNKEQEELLHKAIKAVTTKLTKSLKQHNITADVFVGGSIAKGTFFADKTDVDIFIRFDKATYAKQTSKLSDILEPILNETFPKTPIERLHGSRDYFQLVYQKTSSSPALELEIVPIIKINDANEALNITDVTPLHVAYINDNATIKQKDDIRIAKQFAKANGCYGAESYIGGFSGYVLEILTLYYSSFEELLKASQKWKLNVDPNKKKTVIDPSSFHKGKLISFEIDVSKLHSPIVVVDPVDKWRNAAAALTIQKIRRFQKAAKAFLMEPNSKIFEKEVVSLKSLNNKAAKNKQHLIFITMAPNDGKQDVVGCQILKSFDFIHKELKLFTIKSAGWTWDKETNGATLYYLTKKKRLPKTYKMQGPPTTMSHACKAFQKAHKETYKEQGRLYAIKEYKQRDLEDNVIKILKKAYLKDKFQEITETKIILN